MAVSWAFKTPSGTPAVTQHGRGHEGRGHEGTPVGFFFDRRGSAPATGRIGRMGRTCFWQMCAALRDRKVMHDLVVGAALGRDMEDFATMRWRGHRRSNAGFWGFGAVGPQD